MNIPLIAADIARRIPEMAKDSVVNNEAVIRRMLEDEEKRTRHLEISVFFQYGYQMNNSLELERSKKFHPQT